MSKQNPSLDSLKFPRTQREAGWDPHAEWQDDPGYTLVSILGCAVAGAIILWAFFVVVLGWDAL